MNKIFSWNLFRRAAQRFRPRNAKNLLFAMSFSGMFWLNYYRQSQHQVKMEKDHFENDLIVLTKNDYFDRVLGNETDFFFLIVHQDGHDNLQEATKIAKQLKSLGEENGFKKWNVYVISRSLLTDIKKIIGRAKGINLFSGETEYPLEIYLKTPHSRDFFYLHFKKNKFFSERGVKRTLLKMKKLKELIEPVEFEEDLKLKLLQSANKFNIPTMLMTIDDSDKAGYKKVLKKYSKLAFLSIDRKFFPVNSHFLLINKNLANKLGLEKNTPYMIKNDAITAYERYTNTEFDDHSDCIKIEVDNPSIGTVYLKKYNNAEIPIFRTQKPNLPEEKRKILKTNEIRHFMNFILPRVIMIQDLKYRNMGQLSRKLSENRNKLIISVFCPFNDKQRDKKLEIFMNLYKKYGDQFIYCIFGSQEVEDLFPHCRANYPSFTAFNFFNQKKDYEPFNRYYKNLVYSYEKYFLNPNSVTDPNEQEIEERIQKILSKEADWDFLNDVQSSITELKGSMHKDFLEKFEKQRKDAILVFTGDDKQSIDVLQELENLTDSIPANFYKVTHRNTSSVFPVLRRYPYIIRLSSEDKKMSLIQQHLLTDHVALRIYLQNLYKPKSA